MSFAFQAPPPPPAHISPKEVHTSVVVCEGDPINGVGGHPGVSLTFDSSRTAVCPYCSKLFHLAADAAAHDGH